jgi:DNA polymerase (family X)
VASTLPRNADVAAQFDLLADLMELDGVDRFRVGSYRSAAARIRETGASVAQLALEGRAKELQGIGTTIQGKIVEIVSEGEIQALSRKKAEIPSDVALFMRLPGLGAKTAARIWHELGVTTIADLRAAAEAQKLRGLAGVGAKTEERVLKALTDTKATEPFRPLLGDALPALLAVVDVLRAHPAADQVSEAGSARRRKETIRDLDIIATASDPAALIDYFTRLNWVVEIAAKGETKATVLSNEGYRFDLRVVPPESYGNLLQHFTGSKEHNLALREAAVRKGVSVSEYGVAEVESGEVHKHGSEEELYAFLGYQWIPPELRENCGELEAARAGELPKLVELDDIRGDLHSHSTWSDGKDTLAEMAVGARDRGYAYLAITDHGERLRDGKFEDQWKEVDALNERLKPFRVIKGVEIGIRADGRLGMSDGELAQFEFVIASLHTSFDRNPTERILGALENPYVHMIGHLTARKLNIRGGADVDIDRVIAKAAETGTFLEINAQPNRLDVRDAHARAAAEAGIKVPVNTDAHELRALVHMPIGVAQARRGWLTKDDVLNTRTWPQIKKLLKKP